jgi:hypothetical protein
MLQARHRGLWARSVRLFVAATLFVALFGAATVVHAACEQCTFTGAFAGATASGPNDSGFGYGALTATWAAPTPPPERSPSSATPRA